MLPKTLFVMLLAVVAGAQAGTSHADSDVYGNFPVTVPGYAGEVTDSTSYPGQIARHLLHNALKQLAGQGDGENAESLKAQMMSYYAEKGPGREILDPQSKGAFVIAQKTVDEISKDRDLTGSVYKGLVTGWPGSMTGDEVLRFMIDKAAAAKGGVDPLTGYNYPQLISKFLMGAAFYNQAVDKYLDENLQPDVKPNDQPYGEGAPYTGKEHSWDEAFGYFGAPAHALTLDAETAYAIAKADESVMDAADHDGNGAVDLVTEMTYAHAYYAADADKGGKTNYLHTIVGAFLDGRRLLVEANGQALTQDQLAALQGYASVIKTAWAQVIAEAAFKYAGSVYADLEKLKVIVDSNGDPAKAFDDYVKHWGELKGFAMALATSGRDLGETGVRLDRLIGFGPVLLGGGQVTGVDAEGDFEIGGTRDLGEYMVHMIKVQHLLGESFDLKGRKNDVTADMEDLVKSLGESKSAEND